VEGDKVAQHVRRILWRFRDGNVIFVTTQVDYGDWPAGCITIAAVRETAEKFGGEKKRAAWFLKNRMYVDWMMLQEGQTVKRKQGSCLQIWRT
jgi:hypothetical protein